MKTRVFAFLAVLLVIGVTIGVITLRRQPHLGQQTLPDGKVLTLVGLTVGERHVSPLAPVVDKLGTRLPLVWRNRLKIQAPPMSSAEVSSNFLTVWITAPAKPDGSAQRWQLLVGDDRDNFSRDNSSYSRPISVPAGSNMWLQGIPMLSWPRRAETLRIQLYPDDGSYPMKMAGEFRAKNPGRDRKTRPWDAAPWPVTVKDADLDFTLTSLWLGIAWADDWSLRPQRDPLQRRTRATVRVTKNGEVQTNWNAYHVREIMDATGNWSHGNGFGSTIRNGETMNHFSQLPLPADEPWRMTVEFSRVGGFASNELHFIRGLALPKDSQYRSGVTNAITDKRLLVYWEQPWMDESPYQIGARVEPEPRGTSLSLIRTNVSYRLTLVRATDDQGRDVTIKNHGGGAGSTHDILKLLPDATSVDLLLAYHPSRLVTFLVKPEFYREEKAPK